MKVLEIKKEDLKNNIEIIKEIAGANIDEGPEIIAVVKVNRNGIRYN